MHAWRALGQLRAEASVLPLLDVLRMLADDEAALEEPPVVFGMIGPAAIPPIVAFLTDRSKPVVAHSAAISAIREIAERHPERRAECIAILTRILGLTTHPRLVGFAICALLDLPAAETIDPIRMAFRQGLVDISIPGDLEDVEIASGLRAHRVTPTPPYMGPSFEQSIQP